MSKNLIGGKRSLKTILSDDLEELEKELPYKLPKPFPVWTKLLEYGIMTLLAAKTTEQGIDSLLDFHSNRWSNLIFLKYPVYCLGKNIIRDFESTEIPESEPFLPKDWFPRISDFMIVFPDSVIQTPGKITILYAFVSAFVTNSADPMIFKKGVTISAMSQDSTIFSTIFGIGDNGEILNRERLINGSSDLSQNETEFLTNFRTIVIQSLLCLEYAPQYIEEPAVLTHSQNILKKNPKKLNWSPRMIGVNYERRLTGLNLAVKMSHRSNRMHHRRAFWRAQACGPGHRDRVARWIMPVIVNGG